MYLTRFLFFSPGDLARKFTRKEHSTIAFHFLLLSFQANWPTWKSVIDQYTPNGKVYFTYHLFPLPYHPFSFRASQGAYVLRAMNGTSAAIRYMYEIISKFMMYLYFLLWNFSNIMDSEAESFINFSILQTTKLLTVDPL